MHTFLAVLLQSQQVSLIILPNMQLRKLRQRDQANVMGNGAWV